MKNITLSIQEDLLQAGRKYAQRHHTSLNELIRHLLRKTVIKDSSQSWSEECFLMMDQSGADSKGKKWSREDLYDV